MTKHRDNNEIVSIYVYASFKAPCAVYLGDGHLCCGQGTAYVGRVGSALNAAFSSVKAESNGVWWDFARLG